MPARALPEAARVFVDATPMLGMRRKPAAKHPSAAPAVFTQ